MSHPRRTGSASERNPQAEQMADESMVRNLAAQAQAIWPQERELCLRYDLPSAARVLDVGCGTGEITRRLAELLPAATLVGVDVHEAHLLEARARSAEHGDRIDYRRGDAFALEFQNASFDLVVCRHLLQAIPDAEAVLAELVRVTRPGGVVHVVAEDYAMMHFHPVDVDTDDFWRRGPIAFAERTGSDLRSGRKIHAWLHRLGVRELSVDYVVVDTTRVPRELFAEIWSAWRDGYAEAIARETELSLTETRAAFDAMIACIRSPEGYGVWQLPVISGRTQ